MLRPIGFAVVARRAHAFPKPPGRALQDPMTAEENRRVPLSTEVSPREAEVDPQLSACAQEGPPPGGLPETQPPGRRRRATGRAQAGVSSSTVRLAIGQLLGGRYRIECELAEGGMGVVYLAADEQVPGERFAIKVLKEELHHPALTLPRDEVRTSRKRSQPNIVDVQSVNVDGQRLYVLMEYLEGESLDALLDEEFGRGMPFSHAWPIIEDVGAALGNAHDHNVIHSDLKPANVFVTTSGRTKLLDFGIARVSRGPLLHARSGPRALTPAYASCEMLEGKEADRRDDIYSFACVIYEMLCGERPFGELTALEAREAGTQVPPLQGLSRRQIAALAQALAFDREARTRTVETLLAGLAADSKPRPRPVALFGTAILVAIAAVGLTYFALDSWWVSRHSIAVEGATSNAQPAASASLATIAVLPLQNLSGDASQEYFADGITDALTTDLARMESLQVISRTSTMQYKSARKPLPVIARELNADAIVEGSVQRSGNRVRVTAQLVRATDDRHLWADSYERDFRDVLVLQDEVASDIAKQIESRLGGPRPAPVPKMQVSSPEAYETYLKANYYFDSFDLQKSVEYYTQAIKLDPSYAPAYAHMALAYSYMAFFGAVPPNEGWGKVKEAATLALQKDERLPAGHGALALAKLHYDWDFAGAEREFKRALELNPNDADIRHD